jgi:hypothetical protein
MEIPLQLPLRSKGGLRVDYETAGSETGYPAAFSTRR